MPKCPFCKKWKKLKKRQKDHVRVLLKMAKDSLEDFGDRREALIAAIEILEPRWVGFDDKPGESQTIEEIQEEIRKGKAQGFIVDLAGVDELIKKKCQEQEAEKKEQSDT